jgi:uncharacterized protein YidB (DUF937 family)
MRRTRTTWVALWAACALGCGGAAQGVHPETPHELSAEQIDADPLALLPASAVVVGSVDTRAFYGSGTFGAQLAALSEQLSPVGDEAGFKASRDVDRVVFGTYSLEGLDVAAVVSGRFDDAKIKQAADAHTQARGGGVLAASQYAGRTVYTVNDAGFCVLTPKTALAGTQTGIRRALDRIHDGSAKRELASWVQQTIDTPTAAAVVTADFGQPVEMAAVGSLQLPWAKGVKMVRVIADFKPPGMHVAGTITYADAAAAAGGANGIRQIGTMANLVALTGLAPRLQDLSVTTADTNVQCAFSVDDQSMRNLLGALPRWIH